jgi:hypothetical protein
VDQKRQSVVQVVPDRSITSDEFKLLERIEPATISKMIRQRVQITNYGGLGHKNWLRDNIGGLYHMSRDNEVWFERDEDMLLFLAAFHGKQRFS